VRRIERRETRRVRCVEGSEGAVSTRPTISGEQTGDFVRTESSSQQRFVCVCSSVSEAATRQADGSARERIRHCAAEEW
jgi:hypothetical protein